MHRSGLLRSPLLTTTLLAGCLVAAAGALAQEQRPANAGSAGACPSSDAGLRLARGFCATIFADDLGHPRQMVMAPNGVLYVNTWSGVYYGNGKLPPGGFLVALQDRAGKGKADVIERFGATVKSGGAGGTGIDFYKGALYAEINDKIVRYPLPSGSIVPRGPGEVIVSGMPLGGDHPMHPFVIDQDGSMYVDMGTESNACQEKNRSLQSPGIQPCPQTLTRGGIWRFDANRTNQKFSPAERYATGIRNAEGLAIDATHHILYATQHGRDQLSENWPKLYRPEQSAILPAEELVKVVKGGDYGWPECYYDAVQKKLVLAPEYGGDGGRKLGVCANKLGPVAAFQAHWAPDDLVLYEGRQFPSRYRGGGFIAFHGSWNRAPFPQSGYNVTFQPLSDGAATGKCEIFADGFAGSDELKGRGKAAHRPTGLAVGLDGSLFVSDDAGGRIYRITYVGGEADANVHGTPCPDASAPAGAKLANAAGPPEGLNEESPAGKAAAANLPVPRGSTKAAVALGDRVYHAQSGTATCTGCHGTDGRGTALGPDLTAGKYVWSNGSLAGIEKTITEGVAKPKNYRAAMPAMGGAQLTAEQVSAVSAYVWALGHAKAH